MQKDHKKQQTKGKEEVKKEVEQQPEDDKKDPETLSEGERMGLSKQQLRKLEKRLNQKKKKLERQMQQAKEAEVKEQKAKQKINKQKEEFKVSEAYLLQFNSQKIPIKPNLKLPSQGEDNILITSALPYVNNVPHLGNIIGCVLSADVYSRYKKLQGSNVLYICGTDQYGTATEVKALEEKKTPQEICDHYFKIHNEVYKWFDIGFDYFGRTSTQWHTRITQEIFLNIKDAGRIIEKEMVQLYCSHCDLFLADRFVCGTCPHCAYEDARGDQCDKCQKLFDCPTQMKNYHCFVCKNNPVQKETSHFFIDLPAIQKELEEWIDKASVTGQWSQNSIAITKAWTSQGLQPKCITRDLKWGVSVPLENFKKKVFYVWFDAPIGYISITANLLNQDYKKWWINPSVKYYEFMGKDNVPFHTVIFPSSLIASKQNWTLLHHVSTTEYLNYQNGKFSKRRGTGVFGDHAINLGNEIPAQVWRYYLLVNRPQKSDSQFSWKDFIDKNNNELLANPGNLVNRVIKFIYTKCEKKIPNIRQNLWLESDDEFINELKEKYVKYKQLLDHVEIKSGLKFAMEVSSAGNKYLQASKFWQPLTIASGRTQTVLNVIANFIRFLSFLLEPYLPSTSAKINFLLGIERTEEDQTLGKHINNGDFKSIFLSLTKRSQGIQTPVVLFHTYTDQQADSWRERFGGVETDKK